MCVRAQARQKQLTRLARESALAAQRVRLANGKRITLRDLQVGLECMQRPVPCVCNSSCGV